MKAQLQNLRFYSLALSGTTISADPADIFTAVSVISSESWKQPDHPLHDLRIEGLKQTRRAIVRYRENPSAATKDPADQAVKMFRVKVS